MVAMDHYLIRIQRSGLILRTESVRESMDFVLWYLINDILLFCIKSPNS